MAGKSSPARKEYSRLRSIARKRIDRLQKSGLWSSEKANKARMVLLMPSKMVAESDLSFGISDLNQFLYKSPSTVSAAREQAKKRADAAAASADSLRRNYGVEISDDDMKSFGKYMEWMRERAIDEVYDSGEAVEEFDKLREKAVQIEGVDVSSILKDFKYWSEHQDELEDAQNIPPEYFRRARGEYGQTSRQLRNALNRYYNG